jgi:nitroimidazol reductase NimA-like FMN-containing flavoprotein (pyridoxamine 5'-phosphate oxidase superfamily)
MRMIDSRTGIEVMDRAECLALLETQQVGRLAVVDDGRPMIFPVNYAIDGGEVVFRTAEGSKFDSAARRGPVAFEVDVTDDQSRSGWSVVVNGRAELITSEPELERVRSLPLDPWSAHEKSNWIRVRPDTITGRRVVPQG